jgi:hypothetical protein
VHDKLIGGETEKDFVVYPNPSSGIFLLEGTAWTKDQLLLTDIAGRRVEFELLYENEEQAQISIKSPGVYLLISTVSGQTVRLVSLP